MSAVQDDEARVRSKVRPVIPGLNGGFSTEAVPIPATVTTTLVAMMEAVTVEEIAAVVEEIER